MKSNYLVIALSIVSVVLLTLLFGIRSELKNVRSELFSTRNEISRVNSNISYLEGSMREMEDILSQEDIIVGFTTEIIPIDIIEGTATAEVVVRASNIHVESTVHLVLVKTGYAKGNYNMKYIVDKDSYEVGEEIYTNNDKVGDSVSVEMSKEADGTYSCDIPVLFGYRYDTFVMIEHEGVIFQEQADTIYVHDETSVNVDMHIFYIEYDETDDAVKLDIYLDIQSNHTLSITSAELLVFDGEVEIDRVNVLLDVEEDNYIHGEVRVGAELDEYYSIPYEQDGVRSLVFRVVDDLGRVTELTHIIEMK